MHRLTILLALSSALAADRKPEITTLIYFVNRPDALARFDANAGRISIIAPQTFSMDADGFIAGEVPSEVMRIAAKKKVAVMPLVVNRRFNQPLMHTVLDNPESRARAIRYLAYYALRDGYLGFQFDYENIHYTYRDKFSVFFKETAREFHRLGLQLSVAVVGRRDDVRKANSSGYDNWSGVYDYQEIGRHADFVSVMAYAEHGSTANPGPVASLPWVQGIATYSADTIGSKRVSLGVPFYGQRWDETPEGPRKWRGRSARFTEVADLLKTTQSIWDDRFQSPHLSFDQDGKRVELWYEDARSLQAKMELAREMGFIGISAWVLGQEDPAFWDQLDQWNVRRVRKPVLTGHLDERSKRAARMIGH